jgi:hypothetical protein
VYIYSPTERATRAALHAEKAHTEDSVVARAVFHAPMFALNADADMNACPTERMTAPLRMTAGTAHTEDNVVTAAVFHAPMFALNADADWNACEPTKLGPQRCIVSIRS